MASQVGNHITQILNHSVKDLMQFGQVRFLSQVVQESRQVPLLRHSFFRSEAKQLPQRFIPAQLGQASSVIA